MEIQHERAMIALDIDGTILNDDGYMSDEVRIAVQKVVAADHHLVLATGRGIVGTLSVLERLNINDGWAVCCNGSITIRCDAELSDGYEVIRAHTFDPREEIKLLEEQLPTALYYLEGAENYTEAMGTAPPPLGLIETPVRIVSLAELAEQRSATRVSLISSEHTVAELSEKLHTSGISWVVYGWGGATWIDLSPDGISKGSALEDLRQDLGVPLDATVAIGDSGNDIEMLQWARRSYAMGQALQNVKAAADFVTKDIASDGAVAVLEQFA